MSRSGQVYRRLGAFAGTLIAVAGGSADISAQIPKLLAEGRIGVVVPRGDVGGSGSEAVDAQIGPSFSVGFAYAVRGGLYLHLGFGQHRLGCAQPCDYGDLTATGFDLALRYLLDLGTIRPWVRVAALPYTVSVEADAGGDPLVSDHTWGYDAGVGVTFSLSESVSMSPGVRYLSLEPELNDQPWPFKAWVADVGVAWAF